MTADKVGRAVLDGVLYFYPLIILGALWEICTGFELIGEDVLPRLDFVFGTLLRGLWDGELLWHSGVSLFRVVAGLIIACLLGVAFGLWTGLSKRWAAYLMPLLVGPRRSRGRPCCRSSSYGWDWARPRSWWSSFRWRSSPS